jgi:hypothetical protein
MSLIINGSNFQLLIVTNERNDTTHDQEAHFICSEINTFSRRSVRLGLNLKFFINDIQGFFYTNIIFDI